MERYKDILKDIYRIDPKLKKNEEELMRIIKELTGSKPDIKVDENFQKDLLEKLCARIRQKENKPFFETIGIFIKFRKKLVSSFSGAAALLLIVVIGYNFMTTGNFKVAKVNDEPGHISATTKSGKDKEKTIVDNANSNKLFNVNNDVNAPVSEKKVMEESSSGMMQKDEIRDYGIVSDDEFQKSAEKDKKMNASEFNTEEYDRLVENNYKNTVDDPLSTFSIDVDTASYSNVRRFLKNGELPYKDAVRIEEMINYFSYDYKEPAGDRPFGVNMEISGCPWNRNSKLLLIGIQGKKMDVKDLPQNNLVFLIDVSGSMEDENKLPLVKQSLRMLVQEMRETDKIAIVVYAGSSGLVLPPTSGFEKNRIMKSIDNLEAGGSTAGGEGLMLAYKLANENFIKDGNNRIILSTDGDFNVGPSSDGELVRMIEEQRKTGVYLTILGYGMGNYKDSKMKKLADAGNGNYAYIDSLNEAKKILVDQMGGTLSAIAKDVKIQIEFNPVIVKEYRLIGYENRIMNKEDFEDDAKDAGEIGAGHTVTALYELVVSDTGADTVKSRSLKYQKYETKNEAYSGNEAVSVKIRYKKTDSNSSNILEFPLSYNPVLLTDASSNLQWAASVAEFGMLLRDSEFKGNSNYDNVLELSEKSSAADKEGYRKEFIELVKKAKDLSKKK